MADTIVMSDQVCDVKYVDAGIGVPGDGSTPVLALQDIPAATAMADNTVYLCRRDETNTITIFNSTETGIADHIYLVGMPMATDWIYSRMPSAATSAWGADGDTYCKAMFEAYNSRMIFRNIDDFGCHRIWFVRSNPTAGNANSGTYGNLNAESTRNNGSYFLTNSKWTDDGIDLSDSGWNTNTERQGGSIRFKGGTGAAELTHGRSCRVTDNHIQYNMDYNSSRTGLNDYCAMYYFDDVNFSDNEIWHSSCGGSNSYYVIRGSDIERLESHRNSIHLVVQGHTNPNFYTMFHMKANEINISNITMVVDRYYNIGVATNMYFNTGLDVTQDSTAPGAVMNVTDIDFDFDKLWRITNKGVYLHSSSSASSQVDRAECTCRDISATCVDSGGIGAALVNDAYMVYLNLHSNFTTIENITGHNYTSAGVWLDSSESDGKGPVAKNVSVKGKCYFSNMGFVEVVDWSTDRVEANLLNAVRSGVYVATATLDAGSWGTESWCNFGSAWNNNIIIDSVNVNPYITWTSTPVKYDSVLMNNVDGVTGKWFGSNRYYEGQTWSVNRTGGANVSIKLASGPNRSNVRTALFIAPRPWRGLEWTPSGTGSHTVKAYVAHKLFADPSLLPKRVRFLVEVPNVGGTTIKTYHSDIEGQWEVDSGSTWNGETGLTQMVCTVPFIVEDAAEVVSVRMLFDWWDSSNTGYLYLDPVLVFV